MTTYSIGQIAEEFGLTLRTLRFYEGRGLIAPARKGLQRIYADRDRERLGEIIALAALGFTLSEIKAGRFSREELLRQLEHMRQQRASTDGAIAELERRVAA